MKHIFVVDDDREIRFLIKKYLEKEGFKITDFSDSTLVFSEIKRLSPDLIVMDVMMPGIDGIELCKKIRKEYELPIIFVSARGEEVDRIIGLEVGGDDYLSKPFSPRELLARIKNIFRRLEKLDNRADVVDTESAVMIKNTSLSPVQRMVHVNGVDAGLTMKEFDILKLLMSNQNKAYNRDQLLEKVWGYDFAGEGRVVDDVIKRLRKKLSQAQSDVEILTVWGFGYKIEN
ncbi:MAG: response regulator transcription factor [Vallitaleaceae bacterium]|nr:response regulator transcription factor [Vallitaleaceae bacterium]